MCPDFHKLPIASRISGAWKRSFFRLRTRSSAVLLPSINGMRHPNSRPDRSTLSSSEINKAPLLWETASTCPEKAKGRWNSMGEPGFVSRRLRFVKGLTSVLDQDRPIATAPALRAREESPSSTTGKGWQCILGCRRNQRYSERSLLPPSVRFDPEAIQLDCTSMSHGTSNRQDLKRRAGLFRCVHYGN